MATFKGIKGVKVVTKTADPTASEADGTVWYNSTGDALKYSIASAAAWAAAPNMVVGRNRLGGCGTSTAGLAVGGFPPGGAPNVALCEEYNGTAWAEVNNYPVGTQSPGMAGTQTAALFISGGNYSPLASHKYDGTSWTATGTRNTTGILRCQGCGTQTAAMTTAGEISGYVQGTETFDGSTWTELTNYPIATSEVQVMGTSTLAIGVGGYPGAPAGKLGTDWDGTSWTAGTNCNTGRTEFGSSHVGAPSTDAVIFGGNVPPHTANTEVWNGSSWTEVGDMATSRSQLASGGAITSAIAIGGSVGGTISNATEVFSDAPYTIKTVTIS